MTLVFMRNSILAAALAAFALAAGPALAQPVEPPLSEVAPTLVLDAMGQKLVLPAPDWLTPEEQASGAVRPLVETVYEVGTDRVALGILPKGETEETRTRLYGAQVRADANPSLQSVRDGVLTRYSRACLPTLTAFFQLGEDQGDQLAPVGFVCGAYDGSLSALAGKGVVMVMVVKQSPVGVAVVYEEWRGGAFDPANPASWPLPTADVEARAKQLQAEVTLAAAD